MDRPLFNMFLIEDSPCMLKRQIGESIVSHWKIISNEMDFCLQHLENVSGFIKPHGVWKISVVHSL